MKKILFLVLCALAFTSANSQKKLFLKQDSERTEIFAGKRIIISLTPDIVVRQWEFFQQKAIIKDKPRKVRSGMTVDIAKFDRQSNCWISPSGRDLSNVFEHKDLKVSIQRDSIEVVFRNKQLKTKIPDEI